MAKDDWAIVVGVSRYPDIGDLQGPENDARAFRDWLRSKSGGNVGHIEMIVTSQFKLPFRLPDLAKPTAERVDQACIKLQRLALENSSKGLGLRVGRRLYLYMSGHGFEPETDGPALIMANADGRIRLGSGFHIRGPYTANWFYQAGYFEEVVLFMDCCREVPDSRIGLHDPFVGQQAAAGLENRKRFFACATKWSRLSRERPMADNLVHGVFTQALLTGLRGEAAEPGRTGHVTASSLSNYLLNRSIWRTFLAPEDLNNPEVGEPQAVPLDGDFLLVTVPLPPAAGPPRFPVNVRLPAAAFGKKVEIQNDRFRVVERAIAQPPLWQVSLEPGFYQALIMELGRHEPFQITGVGASPDVQL